MELIDLRLTGSVNIMDLINEYYFKIILRWENLGFITTQIFSLVCFENYFGGIPQAKQIISTMPTGINLIKTSL